MSIQSTQRINDFFDSLYQKHGPSVQSLGWSEHGQNRRFEEIERHLPSEFSSLLDVGCGFGDFNRFMIAKRPHQNFSYTGYDINENFVKTAPALHNGKIELRDFISTPPAENSFDVVVSIGAFNVTVEDNLKLIQSAISLMHQSAKNMALISAQSLYADDHVKHNPDMFFYDPAELFRFAKNLTRNVDLIHSYMPHDFILKIYK